MKKIKYIVALCMLYTTLITGQNNVIDIAFSETSINDALRVITGARAINFGDYKNKQLLNFAWYLNLDNARVDIKPNNTVHITNVNFTGGIDVSIPGISFTPSGRVFGNIYTSFNVKQNSNDGYSLFLRTYRAPTLHYSGSLQKVGNLVTAIVRNYYTFIPEFEINLGSGLLPDMMAKYVKSTMPTITTDENQVVLTFELLFDDIELQNKLIKSAKNETFEASNSIILKDGFHAQNGSKFKAHIVQKNARSNALNAEFEQDYSYILPLGDSVYSDVVGTFYTYEDESYIDEEYVNDISLKTQKLSIEEEDNFIEESPEDLFTITIWDINGRLLYKTENASLSDNLDFKFLHGGIYIINVSSKYLNQTQKIYVHKDEIIEFILD